ncbi:hypothetical protein RvY_05721 [Ramazzottius varieornatus]|uniref:G-protein coupled receptors family 1 profile domain-containing protein n=1 Tax=Ramazzottius varieornatus TaxID=947166 RepID=A0A1D1UZ12_RAMVA|nr:hypothetical protein RvY_05721 [Ramazzottius varieornatus]
MKRPVAFLDHAIPAAFHPEDIHETVEDLLNHARGVCHCSADRINLVFLIFNACFALCAMVTVMMNLAFVLTIALNKQLWKVYTNKLLLSNAVVDMLVGMLVMPFHITKNIQSNCWNYGEPLCDVAQSVDLHLTTLSIFHLTGLAAERYFRIVRVFWYERWIKRITGFVILIFWVLPTPATFVSIYLDIHQAGSFTRQIRNRTNYDRFVRGIPDFVSECGKWNKKCKCSYWASKEFTTVTTVLQFGLPVIVMTYFYLRIIIVAYRHAEKMHNIRLSVLPMTQSAAVRRGDSSSDSLQDMDGLPAAPPPTPSRCPRRPSRAAILFSKDVRMVRLCMLVFLVFLFCWSPYFIMATLEAYCVGANYVSDEFILRPKDHPEESARQELLIEGFYVVVWMGLLNSLLNPMILFYMQKEYRTGFQLMMHRRFGKTARFFGTYNPHLGRTMAMFEAIGATGARRSPRRSPQLRRESNQSTNVDSVDGARRVSMNRSVSQVSYSASSEPAVFTF